jgi:hypothetical protein
MARAILGDINIQKQVSVLVLILKGDEWKEVWEHLHLSVHTFQDLGLSPRMPDADLWRMCQQEQILLLTANRNAQGPDSLEETLRAENRPDSLPVFTLANAQHVLHSKQYAERVVEQFLEYLLDLEKVRGTGRLYLP